MTTKLRLSIHVSEKRHKQQPLAEETSRQMKKIKFKKKSSSATTPLPLLKPSKYSPNQDLPSQQKQVVFPTSKSWEEKESGESGAIAWAFLLLHQSRLKNLPSKQQPLLSNVETNIEGTVSPATNYTPY